MFGGVLYSSGIIISKGFGQLKQVGAFQWLYCVSKMGLNQSLALTQEA